MAEKSKNGLIIAGVIGGIGCISIIGIVILIFAMFLIAAPTLLNAADKAKEGAVKANVSAATSTVITYLVVDELPAQEASSKAIEVLNVYQGESIRSPFDETIPAYGISPAPGVVTIVAVDDKTVELTGYNKQKKVLVTKTIEAPQKHPPIVIPSEQSERGNLRQ